MTLLARLVVKRVERLGRGKAGGGLLDYIGGFEAPEVDEYRVELLGLLVQELPGAGVRLLGPGAVFNIVGWGEYCRWHSGPLDRPDNVLERLYCTRRASGRMGYCRGHSASSRALYDACMSGAGEAALDACRRLDDVIGPLRYSVYMVLHSGSRVKVGVTRSFRLLERIAEQPHGLALVLAETESAYEARRIEMEVSRIPGISDKGGRRLRAGYSSPPALLDAAERAARRLGLPGFEPRLFRIVPPPWVGRVPEARELGKGGYVLRGFWGGYLLLGHAGVSVAVRSSRIMHRAMLDG